MTDSSVEDLLNSRLGDIEKPPLTPPGTWLGTIFAHKIDMARKMGKDSADTYAAISLFIRLVQPDKDVDPALLATFDVKTAPPTSTEFRLDPQGLWKFRRFAETFEIPNAGQAAVRDILPLLNNRNVVFKVVHKPGSKPGDDGEIPIFVNITDLKALG